MKERPILFSGPMIRADACPYGKPGDRLWVREAHARFSVGEGLDRPVPECVAFRASCEDDGGFAYLNGRGEVMSLKVTKWTPSIHMPRWASRITLEITGVRVERLQDISIQDIDAEGVTSCDEWLDYLADYESMQSSDARLETAHEYWEKRWDRINGKKHPWASNPWVWVIEFQKVN